MDLATEMIRHGEGWRPGGWWPIFPIFWLLVWGTLIFVAVRFARSRSWQRGHSAEGVLAERYARGEITVEEYRERLAVLKQAH